MFNQLYMAIVLVKRSDTRELVTGEMERRGLSGILTAEDSEGCAEALASNPLALLVIDDEHEESELVTVLRAAQGRYRIDTRPIYLIPYEPSEKLLALSLEYNILQLHQGEVSPKAVSTNFDELLEYGQRSELQLETFDRVLRARRAGDAEEALTLLRNFHAEEEDNVQGAAEFALSLCECGHWDDAQALLGKIVERFPFDARSKHLLARCHMKAGDFGGAQTYLEQANLLSPHHAERLSDIAQVLMNQYRFDEAMGTLQEALNQDPDCLSARLGQVQCHLLMSDANDALKIMRQLEDASQFASVFNGAAIVAVRAGNFKQGIDLYKLAVTQLGDHPELSSRVFYNMGLGLYKWGKGGLAILAFDRALELDYRNENAKFNAEKLAVKFARPERSLEVGVYGDDDMNEQSIQDALAS